MRKLLHKHNKICILIIVAVLLLGAIGAIISSHRRKKAMEPVELETLLQDSHYFYAGSNISPEELMQAMQAMEQPQEEDGAEPPKIDEPDGPRSAYEVLIDCCSLDEKLMYYLIDVLKRGAEEEFQKLALVTARKAFTQADFLYWFGTKEERADEEEFICVSLMDACLTRLASEGQVELIAALISGDQTTFELFRCEAPELRQLPQATFEWYEKNYLQRFYPLRYLLKHNGVKFLKEREA